MRMGSSYNLQRRNEYVPHDDFGCGEELLTPDHEVRNIEADKTGGDGQQDDGEFTSYPRLLGNHPCRLSTLPESAP